MAIRVSHSATINHRLLNKAFDSKPNTNIYNECKEPHKWFFKSFRVETSPAYRSYTNYYLGADGGQIFSLKSLASFALSGS